MFKSEKFFKKVERNKRIKSLVDSMLSFQDGINDLWKPYLQVQ